MSLERQKESFLSERQLFQLLFSGVYVFNIVTVITKKNFCEGFNRAR